MKELLFPWSSSLLELLSDLGDSCPETCGIVIDAIAIGVRNANTAIIQSLPGKLASLFGKWNGISW